MVDLIIPLGNGSKSKNDELRLFLRSLEKYGRGIRNVIVVASDPPEWLTGVKVIQMDDPLKHNKDGNIIRKILAAISSDDITPEFAWSSDDCVLLSVFDLSICLRFLMAEIKQTFPQMAASGRDVSGEPLSIWNPVDSSSNTIMNPILHSAIRHGNCSEPCGMLTIRPASDIQSILCFAECWGSLADLIRPYSNGPAKQRLPEKMPSSPE